MALKAVRQFIIGCLIVGFLLGPYGCYSGPLVGNGEAKAPPPPRLTPRVVTQTEYRIRPNDTLIITVWEHPELSRERVVSPEGFLRIPLLGDLKVKDLTLGELEKTMSEAITPYVKNPIISIEVKTSPPRKIVTILGAVARPGDYEFREAEEIKLISTLSRAGGYTDAADLERVYLFRTKPDLPTPMDIRGQAGKPLSNPATAGWEKFRIDLKTIISDQASQDVVLQNNDIIILEYTGTSKWNKTVSEITPTLSLIGLILGIIWVEKRLRN